MLQQSTLSISAHQSNQDASFAESDSKDLLQQHDATSSCCPSSSSSCSTTDTFSTGRRSRIGGNDNSVVRAISPEGRRYLKPVNGIQAKGFARSAQRRSSVLTLGSIERLQHFYAKRDLKVNKVGILGFKNSNNATTTTNSVPEEEDDDDLLPEPSTPPRPSWLDLDVETDLDVLLSQCFHDIQSTLSAWSMVSNTAYASSELSDSDPSSDNEGSEYHIASLVHSVSRTIESIRNYTLHRNDLADSALVKLRHSAIHLLSVIREFETTHQRDHAITFDGLAKEREAILRYLGVVEDYAFNPPHHIGAPPVTFSPEIKSLMHKSRSTTTTTTSSSQSTRPGLPDWLDPTCYVNDSMGRYRALLADNRQSLQGGVPDHEPIPDPNDSEEAFLEYLADGRILCNAYNNVVKRSRRPFGFINKVHQETGRTFRAIENLRFFSAACKFRFDLMFHPFEPSEIARKTDRGLTALKPIVVAFCECVIAEFRENLEQVGKKRPLPDQSPVSTTVEKKFELLPLSLMLRNLTSFGRCANIARSLAIPAVSRPVIFARYASNEAIRHNRGFQGAAVEPVDDLYDIREKPESLSYFTGNYKYNDLLIDLAELHKRYADWKGDENVDQTVETSAWKLREKMEQMLAIPLKTSQWRKIVHHLNALASLPKPLPEAVERALQPYKRYDVNATGAGGESSTGVKTLDELGRAYAAGRRKESSARCWVVEGDGQILVNGMPLNNYFQRPVDRDQVTLPLEATQSTEKYNVWTIVNGGGSTGQAEAIKLGIGRALLIHDPELKPLLRQAGCITRDPRVVERKKEGQRKARARYTWVKR